jgi:hypothetical protein
MVVYEQNKNEIGKNENEVNEFSLLKPEEERVEHNLFYRFHRFRQ